MCTMVFLGDVSVILIDRADAGHLVKQEHYWHRILKMISPNGPSIEDDR